MANRGMRDLAKESVWRRSIMAQAQSGKSVRSWCRLHDVKENSFYWWRRELARRGSTSSAPQATSRHRSQATSSSGPQATSRHCSQATSFVSVRVTGDVSAGALPNAFDRSIESRIEVLLPSGRCVRIVGTVDRYVLAAERSARMPGGAPDDAMNQMTSLRDRSGTEPKCVTPRRVPSCGALTEQRTSVSGSFRIRAEWARCWTFGFTCARRQPTCGRASTGIATATRCGTSGWRPGRCDCPRPETARRMSS